MGLSFCSVTLFYSLLGGKERAAIHNSVTTKTSDILKLCHNVRQDEYTSLTFLEILFVCFYFALLLEGGRGLSVGLC